MLFRLSNEYNVKMKKIFLVLVINVRGTYNCYLEKLSLLMHKKTDSRNLESVFIFLFVI